MKRALMIAAVVLTAVAGVSTESAAGPTLKMAQPGGGLINNGLLGQAQPKPPQVSLAPSGGTAGSVLPGMVPPSQWKLNPAPAQPAPPGGGGGGGGGGHGGGGHGGGGHGGFGGWPFGFGMNFGGAPALPAPPVYYPPPAYRYPPPPAYAAPPPLAYAAPPPPAYAAPPVVQQAPVQNKPLGTIIERTKDRLTKIRDLRNARAITEGEHQAQKTVVLHDLDAWLVAQTIGVEAGLNALGHMLVDNLIDQAEHDLKRAEFIARL